MIAANVWAVLSVLAMTKLKPSSESLESERSLGGNELNFSLLIKHVFSSLGRASIASCASLYDA